MEMWVHFYAEQLTRLHKHGSLLQPAAVMLEEGSYFCHVWEREVFRYCFNSLQICTTVRGWASQWEGTSCEVLRGVRAWPGPLRHHQPPPPTATATAGLFLPTGCWGSFSVFQTMKNYICMTSGWLNRLINNRSKLLMWNCSTYRVTDSMWRKLVFCTNEPVLHEAVLYFHFNKRAFRIFTGSITLLPLSFGFSMQTFHKLACSHWIIPGHNRELTHCV